MRIHATINERTVHRTVKEKKPGRYGLTVLARNLPACGFTVAKNGTKTFFVRALRPIGAPKTILGTADDMTAAEAREKAGAAIAEAQADRETGPLCAAIAADFVRRQGRSWKPATRKANTYLIDRHLVPFFGTMRIAKIDRSEVRRWSDSLTGTPGSANRPLPVLPVLSVLMRQAELGYSPARIEPLPQHAALQDAATSLAKQVGIAPACRALGMSRATCSRRHRLGSVTTQAHDYGILVGWTSRKLPPPGARLLSRCRAARSASPLAPCSPPPGRSPRRAAQGAGCRPALATGTPSPPGCPAGRNPGGSSGPSRICNANRACASRGRPGRSPAPSSRSLPPARGRENNRSPLPRPLPRRLDHQDSSGYRG